MYNAIMYGVLGPMEIYAGNHTEFVCISKWTVFSIVSAASLIGYVVVAGVLMILPHRMIRVADTVIFAFSVVSYIQYLFFNNALKDSTGNGISWKDNGKYMLVNLLIWILLLAGIIVALIVLKQYRLKIIKYISLSLSLVQVVAIISIFVTVPSGSNSGYRISSEGEYEIAEDENIIFLVLDSYGNTLFEDFLEEYPDRLSPLKDFTYYTNCDSHYHRTYPSMLHAFTGGEIENYKGEDYRHDAWCTDEVDRYYKLIHDNGWLINIYCDNDGNYYGLNEDMFGHIDNVKYMEGSVRWKRVLVRYINESLYMFLPYVVKPYFEQLTYYFRDTNSFENTFDDSTKAYLRELRTVGLTVNENISKRITVLHSFGAHDAGNVSDLVVCHDMIDEYLMHLKSVDHYDSSTIVIMGDHGQYTRYYDGSGYDPQPLFLVKRCNEVHSRLETDDSKISFDDIMPSILEIIGANNHEYGKTIWEWKDCERARTFWNRDGNTYMGYTYFDNCDELISKIVDDEYVIVE